MTKDETNKEIKRLKDKVLYFRRLAFVYRYGTPDQANSLSKEVDKYEMQREIGLQETYDKLNEIVGRYFFPIYDYKSLNRNFRGEK